MIDPVPFRSVELSDPTLEHDGLRYATVKSVALRRRADCTIWVPRAEAIGTLLILLHGVYGSAWVWPQKAGVHRVAQRMVEAGEIAPMVIAMPSDGLARDGSGYLGHAGEDAERWIIEEIPAVARLAAPALTTHPRVAIAGLSMGGYGALRLGAKYADRFVAISAHSSITEIDQMSRFVEEPIDDYLGRAPIEELSPLHWLKQNRGRLPPLRFDCGQDDSLVQANRELHNRLTAERIEHEYLEFPGGHTWSYWTEHVADTLRFVSQMTFTPGSA